MRDTAHRDNAIRKIIDQALAEASPVEALRYVARDFHTVHMGADQPRVIVSAFELVGRLGDLLPEPVDVVEPETLRSYGPNQARFIRRRAKRVNQDGSLSKTQPQSG